MEATSRSTRLALAVISWVLFVTFLDNTIVAVALADIQTRLHAGIQALQWVVSGYAMTFAGLMLAFGSIGDRLGRRRIMVAGLVVFTAGSVLASAAVTSGMLIGGRVVMGVGAAASEPGTLSMIRQLFPGERQRARALGVWSAIAGLALAAGPVVGGVLVGLWSFRLVFLFNVLAGVIAIAGVLWTLPESRSDSHRPLDYRGFVLSSVAVSAAVFATIFGETEGFATWWIASLYALALVAAGAFVTAERRAAEPALDLGFFNDRGFTSGMVAAFTGFFATFAVFFFIPLFVQLLGSSSPYTVALDFVPMAACMILASALSGRWIARTGPARPMAAGCALAGAGIIVTDLFISPASGVELFGWSLALTGAGLGVIMVAATHSVLRAVPAERSGMAASAVNTSRELGAVFGVTVLGAIVSGQLVSNLERKLEVIRLPGGAPFPPALRQTVITAVTTGAVNQSVPPGFEPVVKEILRAAADSFSSGLDVVLLLAGSLMLATAALAWRGQDRHADSLLS